MNRPSFARLLLAPAIVLTVTACLGEDHRTPLLVTVDDLPIATTSLHPEVAEREAITREMLATLDAHGIKAVGMVTWRNALKEGGLDLLEMWLDAGHELGNHSSAHLDYTRTGTEEFIGDIDAARNEIEKFLEQRGRQLRFFRFPMLHEGETLSKFREARSYLERTGQRNLPVTIDNQDYSFERPWVDAVRGGNEAEMNRVAGAYHESLHLAVRHHRGTASRLFGRDVPQILLLHAGSVGAAQWDRLFTWLESEGYRFASADEVLADPAYQVDPPFVGTKGYSLWYRISAIRADEEAVEEVRALLLEQSQAWSDGDLERFTAVYADDASFITPSGMTRGRQAVYDRYRASYPDRAAMGILTLEIEEARPISGVERSMLDDARPGRVHAVTVIARWRLSYPGDPEKDDAEGLTLIVFRRYGGSWEIVQDASM